MSICTINDILRWRTVQLVEKVEVALEFLTTANRRKTTEPNPTPDYISCPNSFFSPLHTNI